MSKPLYDFTDRHIRYMVDSEHFPVEQWGDELEGLVRTACKTCNRVWPCPSRTELDRWHADEKKFQAVMSRPLDDLQNAAVADVEATLRASLEEGQ